MWRRVSAFVFVALGLLAALSHVSLRRSRGARPRPPGSPPHRTPRPTAGEPEPQAARAAAAAAEPRVLPRTTVQTGRWVVVAAILTPGAPAAQVGLFVASAVEHLAPSVDVVLLTDPSARAQYQAYLNSVPRPSAGPRLSAFPANGVCVTEPCAEPLDTRRFAAHAQFLSHSPGAYEAALLLNGGDAHVQSDPFQARSPAPGVALFPEAIPVADAGVYPALRVCFATRRPGLPKRDALNGKAVMGHPAALLKLLRAYNDTLSRARACRAAAPKILHSLVLHSVAYAQPQADLGLAVLGTSASPVVSLAHWPSRTRTYVWSPSALQALRRFGHTPAVVQHSAEHPALFCYWHLRHGLPLPRHPQVVAALGLPLFEHLAQHRTSPGGCPRPVHGGLVCGLPVGSRPGSAYNLAISAGPHDFNIAVSDADGQVQVHLELGHILGGSKSLGTWSGGGGTRFHGWWQRLTALMGPYTGNATASFGVLALATHQRAANLAFQNWVRPRVPHQQSLLVHHHHAHACYAFFDSPFLDALILSVDGGGDDGAFRVFVGSKREGVVARLDEPHPSPLVLGQAYKEAAMIMPAIASEFLPQCSNSTLCLNDVSQELMHLAALGTTRKAWVPLVTQVLKAPTRTAQRKLLMPLVPKVRESVQSAMDYAHTVQLVLEQLVISQAVRHIAAANATVGGVSGIVLTGGTALNVRLSHAVYSHFQLPVHVPAAPHDAGLSLGMLWAVQPPLSAPGHPFLGLPLLDAEGLPAHVAAHGATPVGPEGIAKLLLQGHIVGLVRGRMEVGLNGLGHRSILAMPNNSTTRERICRLLGVSERGYLGVALLQSALRLVTQDKVTSPCMSSVVLVDPAARGHFSGAVLHDGTMLVQTIQRTFDDYFHEILERVSDLRGPLRSKPHASPINNVPSKPNHAGDHQSHATFPAVLNVPFRRRTAGLATHVHKVLEFLTLPTGPDFVVVEGWLFSRRANADPN